MSTMVRPSFQNSTFVRSIRLSLDHHGSAPDIGAGDKHADPQLHQVAATQLAVDSKIKKRAISQALLTVEEGAERPDLLLTERSFGAFLPAFQVVLPCIAGSN